MRQPKPAARNRNSAVPAAVHNLEAYLHGLADEILLLAAGDGVAIALAENGEMRCRAANGIAPPMGARIDARSGLTGACLAAGTLLRCDDSEQDGRVDRQVCRALGIRSMICLPVSAGEEIVGLLEIFSSRPNAFLSLDLGALHARAEEIALAFSGEEALLGTADLGVPSWTPAPHPAPLLPRLPLSPKVWQAVLGSLVLALGLLLFLRAIRGSAPAASAGVPQPTAVAVPAAAAEPPAPRKRPQSRRRARLRDSARAAAQSAAPAQPASLPRARAAQTGDTPAPPSQVLIATEAPGGDPLSQFVSSLPPPQPSLAQPRPISSGVPPPVLVWHVQPHYPGLARQNGVQGAVVLEGLVNEEGKVIRLRVDSGNSLLVAAALRAVQQWRYRPSRLNGRPVQVPIRIVLNFELGR